MDDLAKKKNTHTTADGTQNVEQEKGKMNIFCLVCWKKEFLIKGEREKVPFSQYRFILPRNPIKHSRTDHEAYEELICKNWCKNME